MKKYKQKIIPKVNTETIKNNPQAVRDYYTRHLQGRCVTNLNTGLIIHFTSDGKGKIGNNKAIYAKKVAVLSVLPTLLEVAEFNNFGQRKEKDKQSILGYLNFKAKVFIDDKLEHLRIAVTMKIGGKAYYNHEINQIVICKN